MSFWLSLFLLLNDILDLFSKSFLEKYNCFSLFILFVLNLCNDLIKYFLWNQLPIFFLNDCFFHIHFLISSEVSNELISDFDQHLEDHFVSFSLVVFLSNVFRNHVEIEFILLNLTFLFDHFDHIINNILSLFVSSLHFFKLIVEIIQMNVLRLAKRHIVQEIIDDFIILSQMIHIFSKFEEFVFQIFNDVLVSFEVW